MDGKKKELFDLVPISWGCNKANVNSSAIPCFVVRNVEMSHKNVHFAGFHGIVDRILVTEHYQTLSPKTKVQWIEINREGNRRKKEQEVVNLFI